MDVLIGLLLLAAGIVVGIFIGKFIFNDKEKQSSNIEVAVKQLMAQQASHYISQSKQAVDQLGQQVGQLQQQLADYESLLGQVDQAIPEDSQQLSYFGDQASTYLRNQHKNEKRAPSNADSQPLDFSDGSSGLFRDSKKKAGE